MGNVGGIRQQSQRHRLHQRDGWQLRLLSGSVQRVSRKHFKMWSAKTMQLHAHVFTHLYIHWYASRLSNFVRMSECVGVVQRSNQEWTRCYFKREINPFVFEGADSIRILSKKSKQCILISLFRNIQVSSLQVATLASVRRSPSSTTVTSRRASQHKAPRHHCAILSLSGFAPPTSRSPSPFVDA